MLKGESIILRPLKMSDWEKTLLWRNNITIKQLAMLHPFPITEMVEKEWYENMLKSTSDKTIYFTISTKDDNPVGFITLNKINYTHKNCYIGIVIGDFEAQGKGYGKEAMEIAIKYAFDTLNINKITLEVVENNISALALYKKLGFIEEGRLKRHFYAEGEYLDVLIYSIFR
jgi:UDP-4-amino-4,6-dideoxy-N-acetyl-beta-L-altrosamine N-acetyltransferase